MKTADQSILRDAIARNSGAVISLPSAGMLRHHKTRFLANADDGFWLECPAGEQPLIDALLKVKHVVGVSMRTSVTKVVFATQIRQYVPGMQINAETTVPALLMTWPKDIKAVQRRTDYRATIPLDGEIRVHVWRIPEHHVLRDKPSATTMLTVTARDLSVGGMGVVWTGQKDVRLASDQRLRIAVTNNGDEFLLDGRVKHVRDLPSGDRRIGIQFKKLENDIEGRRTLAALTHVVGELQRIEARKRKLSLSRSA